MSIREKKNKRIKIEVRGKRIRNKSEGILRKGLSFLRLGKSSRRH